MIVALVALLFVASGCRGVDVRPELGPVSSPTVAPVGGPVAFHVQLGAGQRLTTCSPRPPTRRCSARCCWAAAGTAGTGCCARTPYGRC